MGRFEPEDRTGCSAGIGRPVVACDEIVAAAALQCLVAGAACYDDVVAALTVDQDFNAAGRRGL